MKKDYRELRQLANAFHDRFSELNYDTSMSLGQKFNLLLEYFKGIAKDWEEVLAYLDEFQDKFDEHLYNTVYEIFEKWLADGVFDDIVADLVVRIGDLDSFREWDRTLIEKLHNESKERAYNVKWFGAKGDGINDDTTAIENALIEAKKTNSPVLLPFGKYIVTRKVYNDSVYGDGHILYNGTKITFNATPLKRESRMNTESVRMAKKTYGTYDNAAVASVVANEDGARAEVQGMVTSREAAGYGDRDSVGLYVHNKAVPPTISIPENSNVDILSSSFVLPPNYDIDLVKETMIVDTVGTKNYTAIITGVDKETRRITIQDTWYVRGGDGETGVPTNNDAIYIDKNTKVWALNANVVIPVNRDQTGVVAELGILNDSGNISVGGVDLVNFRQKSGFGYRARASNPLLGYLYGYMSYHADHAYTSHSTNPNSNMLLSSFIGSDYTDQGFNINNNGRISKLKLAMAVIGNGVTEYTSVMHRIFILTKTIDEDFKIIPASGRVGEMIFIVNQRSGKVGVKADNTTFLHRNNQLSGLALVSGSYAILVSDNTNWVVLASNMFEGNAENSVRTAGGVPTTSASALGMTWVDTLNKDVYISVSIGNGASDWVKVSNT